MGQVSSKKKFKFESRWRILTHFSMSTNCQKVFMCTLENKTTSQTKNQVSKVQLHVEKCWHPIIHIQKDDT